MFVIFNIGALIQTLIIGGIFAVFSLFIYVFNLDHAFVKYNDYYLIIPVLYFFYAILALTDKAGVKGKLFFFSTWFLCLVIILLLNPGLYFKTKDKNIFDGIYFCLNIIFPLYLWYRMVRFGLAKFNYQVAAGRITLLQTEYNITESYKEKNTAFWGDILKSSYYPPFMYRNFNSFYRMINREAPEEEELADHYITIIEKIEGKAIVPSDNIKLDEAKQDLIKFKNKPDFHLLNYDYIKSVIGIILKENKIE